MNLLASRCLYAPKQIDSFSLFPVNRSWPAAGRRGIGMGIWIWIWRAKQDSLWTGRWSIQVELLVWRLFLRLNYCRIEPSLSPREPLAASYNYYGLFLHIYISWPNISFIRSPKFIIVNRRYCTHFCELDCTNQIRLANWPSLLLLSNNRSLDTGADVGQCKRSWHWPPAARDRKTEWPSDLGPQLDF